MHVSRFRPGHVLICKGSKKDESLVSRNFICSSDGFHKFHYDRCGPKGAERGGSDSPKIICLETEKPTELNCQKFPLR